MATDGRIGYQTFLAFSPDGAAYTTLAQLIDCKGAEPAVDDVEVSNCDSPSACKEFIPGLEDPGEITANFVYKKTIVTAIRALRRVSGFWRITIGDGSTWVCAGYVKRMGHGQPLEDKQTVDLTAKLSGLATFTAG